MHYFTLVCMPVLTATFWNILGFAAAKLYMLCHWFFGHARAFDDAFHYLWPLAAIKLVVFIDVEASLWLLYMILVGWSTQLWLAGGIGGGVNLYMARKLHPSSLHIVNKPESGHSLTTLERIEGVVDLDDWLHTQMVWLHTSNHQRKWQWMSDS